MDKSFINMFAKAIENNAQFILDNAVPAGAVGYQERVSESLERIDSYVRTIRTELHKQEAADVRDKIKSAMGIDQ